MSFRHHFITSTYTRVSNFGPKSTSNLLVRLIRGSTYTRVYTVPNLQFKIFGFEFQKIFWFLSDSSLRLNQTVFLLGWKCFQILQTLNCLRPILYFDSVVMCVNLNKDIFWMFVFCSLFTKSKKYIVKGWDSNIWDF
jgi:hypothetical protein